MMRIYGLRRYVEDDEGIKKYFAAFHLLDKFPVAVVVDDFGEFFIERCIFFFFFQYRFLHLSS